METEIPFNPKYNKYEKYFVSFQPHFSALQEELYQVESKTGVTIKTALSDQQLPNIINSSVSRSIELAQLAMQEAIDKLVLQSKIQNEIERLRESVFIVREEERINSIDDSFYKLLSGVSSIILSITYIFLKCSENYKEFLDFLDFALKPNVKGDLNKMLEGILTGNDIKEVKSPLAEYLLGVISPDVATIYSTKDTDIISTNRNRITLCIGIVNYLQEMKIILKGYKKYPIKEG